MISRFPFSPRSVGGLGLTFMLLVLVPSAARAQDAANRSPFLPEGTAEGAVATENAPLEFRGRVSTKSGYMFALYDPSKHLSMWARLNEPGADFQVKSNDLNNDTITVDYQGRTLTLAMKESKVETMSAASLPTQVIQRPGMPPVMSSAPNQAEESRRLEAVATEVRRRRMLRAQAAGGPPGVPRGP